MSKLDEIKKALQAATPGPWTVRGFSVRKSDGYMIRQERPRAAAPEAWEQIDERYAADARLIANAPEWLQWAVQEIERLLEERDKLIEGLRKLAKTNAENISEIREWKANQNDPEVTDLDWYNYVARDILKEIGVNVDD